jgi:CMP-N,N'-diacetyllegionaminic acid synthase
MKDEILCTICARGGSKGIKNKNIRNLSGKPLIAYTIEQAIATKLFAHIVVSTDSDDIADISQQYGAEVFFKREASLAKDAAGKLDVIVDAVLRSEKHFEKSFKYILDLQPTSPLREDYDIVLAFEQFLRDNNDVLITATPSKTSPYFSMVEVYEDGTVFLSKKTDKSILRRQDAPKTYDMNGSIYIWKKEVLLKKRTLFLKKTGLYVMPEERSVDIDTMFDFEFTKFLMTKKITKQGD